MAVPPRHIMPGPLSQIRPGETRIYFAVPTYYDIGETFSTYKEAADTARERIKTFDYGGCSREWVIVRVADETGDREIHRVEIFAGPTKSKR